MVGLVTWASNAINRIYSIDALKFSNFVTIDIDYLINKGKSFQVVLDQFEIV